jgi:hypothetical protein
MRRAPGPHTLPALTVKAGAAAVPGAVLGSPNEEQ